MTHFDAGQLIDPELREALGALPPLAHLSRETLEPLREAMSAAVAPGGDGPDDRFEQVVMEAVDPGAPPAHGLLFRPEEDGRRAAVLWLHGGGYVTGSARRDGDAARSFALEHDCVVLSVDYRLAPEAPFPAAHEDAWTALGWLHENAGRLNVDPSMIGVRGNSAGGGIAAGIALRARDTERFPISYLILVYPMVDDRTRDHPVAGREVWTANANRFGWASYLGDRLPQNTDAYAVPARADSYRDLPPVWIGCGALDLFLEENIELARRLARDGVPVELHVYPGAYHGFNLVQSARVARRFDGDLKQSIARWLGAVT